MSTVRILHDHGSPLHGCRDLHQKRATQRRVRLASSFHISQHHLLEPLVSGKLGYLQELKGHRILTSRLSVIAPPQITGGWRNPPKEYAETRTLC